LYRNQTKTIMKNKFDVISPDGFSISYDEIYNTLEEAYDAFIEWKKRYERQGYYSSTHYGRIPLDELESYCNIIKLK
jgi:hypothetical protein